jgi:hypothetical protein
MEVKVVCQNKITNFLNAYQFLALCGWELMKQVKTQPSHTSRTAFLVNELIPLLLQGALSSVDSMV